MYSISPFISMCTEVCPHNNHFNCSVSLYSHYLNMLPESEGDWSHGMYEDV